MKPAVVRFAVAVLVTAFASVPGLSGQDGSRGVFGDLALVRNSESRSISAENPNRGVDYYEGNPPWSFTISQEDPSITYSAMPNHISLRGC